MAITQEDIVGRDIGYNAADVTQIRSKKRDVAFRERADEEVIRQLLSTSQGRDWIWRVLGSCGVFTQSFVPGAADSTAFNEGKRAVGNQLLAEITKADPDGYLLTQREHAHG